MRTLIFVLLLFCVVMQAARPASAQTVGQFTCNIGWIGLPAEGPRLTWNCDAPAPGAGAAKINWFAFHLGQNPERGRLVLSMLMTAKAAGRHVRLHYHIDGTHPNGWDMGCNPADCRPILAVDMF